MSSMRENPLFDGVRRADPRLRALVDGAEERDYAQGEIIMEEGSWANSMFFCSEGSFETFSEDDPTSQKAVAADVDHGKIPTAGEVVILYPQRRKASVRATSMLLTLAWIREEEIVAHFGSVEALLREQNTDAPRVME